MKTVLQPAGNHVLVVDTPVSTEISGIRLPDNVRQQEMVFGTVVSCGPLVVTAKAEDRIAYGPYAGKGVVLNGVEFRIMKEEQIEAYVRTVNPALQGVDRCDCSKGDLD